MIGCEVRGEADEESEWSVLEPAGEGSEDSMKGWCRLWAMLGVQEMHIRELVLLMVSMEWPEFEGEEIAVWASDAPRTVASAWKGSQAIRGQIRIRGQGAPISVGNRHVVQGTWAVAGRQRFENRKKTLSKQFGRNGRANVTVESERVFLQFPLPGGAVAQEWQEHRRGRGKCSTATAAAADMILTAPTWTRGRGVAVKWEPLVWGCEQERQSVVCIRITQTVGAGRKTCMDREKTRAQLVLRVNEVQAKCWPHKAAWRGDEVDFIGYVNEQGLLEGMVTLAKGEGEGNSMEEEVLVGSALAFDDKVLSWGTSFRREQARARGQNGAPC